MGVGQNNLKIYDLNYKMYKSIQFLIRNRKFSTEKFFIRNAEFPICSNCLHFIEPTNTNPYDGYRCKKFGEMNLVTGEIRYELAANCRLDDDMCGEEGEEYSAKNKTHST